MDENKEKKRIEIVDGDGSNLDISGVYSHINDAGKPKSIDHKPKNVVVPKEHKKAEKED